MSAPAQRPTVLLVDDHRPFLESLTDWLALTVPGVRVVAVERAEDALGIVVRQDVRLVVTDIAMPGMDGFELVERLRREHPTVAVLVVTALPPVTVADRLREHRPDDVLAKPVELDRLEAAIREVISPDDGGSAGMAPLVLWMAVVLATGAVAAGARAAERARGRSPGGRPPQGEECSACPVPRA